MKVTEKTNILEGFFPKEIEDKYRGKKLRPDVIRTFLEECRDAISVSYIASGEESVAGSKLKTAIIALYVLWQEKEELRQKLEDMLGKTNEADS